MRSNRFVGFYERRIFPWLNDLCAGDPHLVRVRARALAGARGRVLEIGFGSGPNLAHYSPAVERIVGIEPNVGMIERAVPQIRASAIPVDVVVANGEQLPFGDRLFDTAVSTLTLCSVVDPGRALRELRRVLKDDGQLIIVEHGLSPDPSIARWQNRLNRVQNVMACGCHLNRPIADLVDRHGFRSDALHALYVGRLPKTHGWVTSGTAAKA